MGSYSPAQAEIIFRSKLPDIAIPDHLPLHSYCFQNLSAHAHRPCLLDISTGASLSYAEVDLSTRRVAAGLHNLGIRPGHVILLLLSNCPAFPISFLAASRLGAITSTENPFHTPAEIAKQAAASAARLVITEPAQVGKVLPLGLPMVVVDDGSHAVPDGCIAFSDLMFSDESAMPEADVHPDDIVALPYSSGTTGLPKGVMLAHRGLVTNVAQQVDGDNPNMYLHPEDVILCLLPMFHIYSLNSVLLCGLRTGATIVIMKKFDVVAMMEVVERYGVTFAPLVPPIVVEMAKNPETNRYDGSSVRMIMSGAAPMGKELQETLRTTFPNAKLGQGYGMTEAGPVLSLSLAFAKEPFEAKSGSCGTAIRNAELKIVDPDTGFSLPRNQRGEICVRGKQIMKGYLNNSEATIHTIDRDGWLHTGDIGFVDDDDEIYIVDRLKELIKYKGYQVAPAELEALLLAHPHIVDAATVAMKDDLCGEIPVAFIVRSEGSNISENEIKQFISKQVVFYKRIHRVFFVEAIPKGATGKILRKVLVARLASSNDEGLQVAH